MRLFAAIDLGDAIRAEIARALRDLPPIAPEARWADLASLHATLAFLGETDEARVPAIVSLIQDVAARHDAFDLTVKGGGAFGPPKRPRVLWLGLSGAVKALTALQADLARALVPLGYVPEERAFSPHLTLARAHARGGDAELADCAAKLRDVEIGQARIDAVILYKSEHTLAGARYTEIGKGALGPRE